MPIRTQQDIDSDQRILKTEDAVYTIPFEADDLVFALVDDHALPPSDSDLDANLDTVSTIHKALASVPGLTRGEHLIVLGKLLLRLGNRCVIDERNPS